MLFQIKYYFRSVKLAASDLCVVWLDWWIFTELRVCVFIVDIVTDADELLSTVCAGYKDYSHSYSVALWNQSRVRSVSLEGAGRKKK